MTKTQTPKTPLTDAQLRMVIGWSLYQNPTTKWTHAVRTLRSAGCTTQGYRLVAMLRSDFGFAAGRSRSEIAAAA